MKKNRKLFVLSMILAATVMATSCQKEKNMDSLPENNQMEYGASPQNPDITDDTTNFLFHQIPASIRQIMTDEDCNCCYDTANFYHLHTFDTTGFYTYAFPSLYFENQWLVAVADDLGLVVKYVWDFEDNFDYNTYYQNNTPAYVTAYTDDFTQIFFIGQVNLRTNELYFTYINSSLWETRTQPGYERFCNTWATVNTVWSISAGLIVGGPAAAFVAGAVVSVTSLIVQFAVC